MAWIESLTDPPTTGVKHQFHVGQSSKIVGIIQKWHQDGIYLWCEQIVILDYIEADKRLVLRVSGDVITVEDPIGV